MFLDKQKEILPGFKPRDLTPLKVNVHTKENELYRRSNVTTTEFQKNYVPRRFSAELYGAKAMDNTLFEPSTIRKMQLLKEIDGQITNKPKYTSDRLDEPPLELDDIKDLFAADDANNTNN